MHFLTIRDSDVHRHVAGADSGRCRSAFRSDCERDSEGVPVAARKVARAQDQRDHATIQRVLSLCSLEFFGRANGGFDRHFGPLSVLFQAPGVGARFTLRDANAKFRELWPNLPSKFRVSLPPAQRSIECSSIDAHPRARAQFGWHGPGATRDVPGSSAHSVPQASLPRARSKQACGGHRTSDHRRLGWLQTIVHPTPANRPA